jgi:hypothetical protein
LEKGPFVHRWFLLLVVALAKLLSERYKRIKRFRVHGSTVEKSQHDQRV